MNADSLADTLRRIPSVDQLLNRPDMADWVARTSHSFVVSEIQRFLGEVRTKIRSGEGGPDLLSDPHTLTSGLMRRLEEIIRPSLRPLINATGVIIHTNLGRAPLSRAAQDSLSAAGAFYTNLEYDLEAGGRSHRDRVLDSLLRDVLGAPAATVVNNNAAALLLALNTVAFGREVIVSRGELVEIGGSFRIPEILARSGAVMREVGATNKTRIDDYRAAINPDTALILRVHPSNFRIRGFTCRPSLEEMLGLARSHGLPLLEDIGSGCLLDLREYGIVDEPIARDSLAAGVDLVCFSCDKLLGGPQAGILAGSPDHIAQIRGNPLMRTYRVGKLISGALEATLRSYRSGRAMEEIPVLHMISLPYDLLKRRVSLFLRRLRPKVPPGAVAAREHGESVIGGGSCPDHSLPTPLISIRSDSVSAGQIESRLRGMELPIIVRVEDDRVLVDLRTVFPVQEGTLLEGLVAALS